MSMLVVCRQGVSAVTLCQGDQFRIDTDERDSLKITLKIFLNALDFAQIRQCLNAVFEQLNTDRVEQLIISFPELEVNSRFFLSVTTVGCFCSIMVYFSVESTRWRQ